MVSVQRAVNIGFGILVLIQIWLFFSAASLPAIVGKVVPMQLWWAIMFTPIVVSGGIFWQWREYWGDVVLIETAVASIPALLLVYLFVLDVLNISLSSI